MLAEVRAAGAFTVGITNEASSSMVHSVDVTLLIHGQRERSVAATKTFTGQMMIFYMLAEALAGASDVTKGFERIPEFCEKTLVHEAAIRELAQRYTFMEYCVVIGRGLLYGNAFELALKLMETCYVVGERFSTADFFHGPLAMVERHFPVIRFAAPGVMMPGIKTLAHRLRELRAETVVIDFGRGSLPLFARAVWPCFQKSQSFLRPSLTSFPASFFRTAGGSQRADPDTPRWLSKVTRTL